MVVHPGAGNPSGTLVNALLHYLTLPNTSSVRPGIVHRLDKETSGIMIAAKTEQSHARLVDLFKHRSMHKEYLAISLHTPREGIVSMPIGRHPVKRTEMCVCPTGKEAITEISVLAKSKEGCLIRALPKTGRTHQIRVHLKALNAPICGDPIYGDGDGPMLLHAHKLSFIHPFTHQPIQFTASIPKEFCRKKPSLCSIVGAP